MQVATLATRKAKDRDLTTESLREAWRTNGAEIGLDREAIGARLGHERPGPTLLTALQVERSVTAHVSHFDRREAIQAVADNLPHGAPAAEVEELADAFLASESVIRIGEGPKGERFTTQRIYELEQRALAAAERMGGTTDRVVVDPIVVSRVLDARPSLKADQRAMVSQLLGGGRALEIVIGEAGTGKTYATVAAAEGWAAGSHELFVAAPTWRAANVLRSEGLDATSIARLLADLDRKADAAEAPMQPGSVLLIDEAGMVDSATLARLIDHAQAADAKLVLIGDPAQLGEIEAGGLFAAIANRSEPVVLDEVIRHRHELDREGAKRIREGEGREALDIYRSSERVIVAADPEARREEMVNDWWQSFGQGEDALMVAKRNAEVEKLNALARERMRAEGRLGEAEIEVGEARFAAGDQVITRVNDHKAKIYNRERWRVEAVDPESGALVLDGIDTRGRVCVDSVFLGRVTNYGDPALQHAYAATTYQAQGATVDRAYVMADPSMDRQEFYVAASRTREETFFYATPEVQFDREEIAPRSPHSRQGLEHIAEAAERDGSQSAAHDEALRSSLGRLSTEELTQRRQELRAEAGAERHNEESHNRLGGADRPRRSRPRPDSRAGRASRRAAPAPAPLGAGALAERRPIAAARQPIAWKLSSAGLPPSSIGRGPRPQSSTTCSPSASAPSWRPCASPRPPTSSRSWGRGPATYASARPGTAQLRGSRAIAKRTAFGTETARSVRVLIAAPRGRNGRLSSDDCERARGDLGREQAQSREAQRGAQRSLGIGR